MCSDNKLSDYDIRIGFEYYNNDYDNVEEQQEEITPQTDILFE